MPDTPMTVVLRREWFQAFKDGTKREEWRRYGPRWNEGTCRIGRPVRLTLGYSPKHGLLTGEIIAFRVKPATGAAAAIYGQGTKCAVFTMRIEPAA